MRTQLTAEFAALADTEGTFQNTSRHAVIEIATSTTKNTGIVLRAGETRSIKSDDTLYARVAEVSDNTETVYLAHEPFKGTGEGGDSRDSRKPSTAYAVGALVDGAGLEPGLALRCTTAGTTAAAALDCSGYELGDTITDGTAEWLVTEYVTLDEAGGISPRVTGSVDLGSASKKWRKLYLSDDGLAKLQNDFSSDAAAHNSIFRGKELSHTWAELQAKAQAHDYSGLYIGDYKTITLTGGEQVVMELAGISMYSKAGSTEIGPHLDFISRDCLTATYKFNDTNTNNGTASEKSPWRASALFASLNDASTGVVTKLPSDLSPYILEKKALLEERYSSGGPVGDDTDWSNGSLGKLWTLTEIEVFGTASWSEIGFGTGCGGANCQYPIFRLAPSHIVKGAGNGGPRTAWWESSARRGLSTTTCYVNYEGSASRYNSTQAMGVPLCFRIG
jgi:hypothetical protein